MSEIFFGSKRLKTCTELLATRGESFVLGRSVFGRKIPCVRIGTGRPHIVCVAGHHAREHLSSEALFRAVLRLTKDGMPFSGTLFVVLSANPDGAELCVGGIESAPPSARDFLCGVNGGSDFSMWKANGRAVDLNLNFPAKFGEGKGNRFRPAAQGYVGPHPLSEPENVALVSLLEGVGADGLLSFHTKGEVLFWEFGQRGAVRARDRAIARRLSSESGFRLVSARGSTGGLKDFAVQYLGIPAFTVELGPDELSHPLPYQLADRMAAQIMNFPRILAEELERRYGTRNR